MAKRLLNSTHYMQKGKLCLQLTTRLGNAYYKITSRYMRLSRANEALNDNYGAQEAITSALRRPELVNNAGLVDHLISLQNGGRGLPADIESFLAWTQRTFDTDERSAELMRGIDLSSLWWKRIREHAQRLYHS